MINKKALLEPDGFYHIYNRAHGNERMFLSDDNYAYFLKRFDEVMGPLVVLHCYCLMPNHFHFLIQVKSEAELVQGLQCQHLQGQHQHEHLQGLQDQHLQGLGDLGGVGNGEEFIAKLLIQKFSNFFNGYTKAFNKQHQRMGGLFMSPFNRLAITTDRYRQELVRYIHLNPVEARLCGKPEEWKYSSYSEIIKLSNDVVGWFDDLENFKVFHST